MPRPRRLRSTRWMWALPVLVLAAGLALLVTLLSGAAPTRTLVHATHLPSPGTTTTAPPQPSIAAPSLRSVTVTPSRDLVDFEPVTIAGIKFPGNSLIETAQCVPGQVGYSTCDLATLVSVNSSNTGSFSLQRTVRRIITVASGRVDCASASGACRMVAAMMSNFDNNGWVALSFNPAVPPRPAPVPKITVTPSTGLAANQVVKLVGSGFYPNSSVLVDECVVGTPPGTATCDLPLLRGPDASVSGQISGTWIVHRIVHLSGPGGRNTTFDCGSRRGACALYAGSLTNYASVPLSFGVG